MCCNIQMLIMYMIPIKSIRKQIRLLKLFYKLMIMIFQCYFYNFYIYYIQYTMHGILYTIYNVSYIISIHLIVYVYYTPYRI